MTFIAPYLRNPWAWAIALILPVTVFPVFDLTVSSWFFDAAAQHFPIRDSLWAEWVRKRWPVYMLGAVALIPPVWLWGVATKRPVLGLTHLSTLFLILSLALGPGILINFVLKDHWGRPRPATIAQFGGPNAFYPPVLPGGPCPKNCSFPSGHASLAFWAVAPAALTAARWRRKAVAAALAYGLIIGTIRIAEGGHFLSDVLYAGLITCAVTHILYKFLILPSIARESKL